MDLDRFDALARALTRVPSRRHVLRGLAGAGLGLAITRPAQLAEARKKRKRKKKQQPQATPNAFGCLDVDVPCTTAEQCCSGICEGKKGKRACRAHDVGDCQAGSDPEGCGATDIPCTTSSGADGFCSTTTGNAGYCLYTGDCYPCRTDVECQRANGGFFGPTAACIRCAECAETGGFACALTEMPGPAMLG